jgi:hypothetical protein
LRHTGKEWQQKQGHIGTPSEKSDATTLAPAVRVKNTNSAAGKPPCAAGKPPCNERCKKR